MKKVFTIFSALLLSSAVFATRSTDPSVESSIAFIKAGSVVKVIYSSGEERIARVTITDMRGKEVFSEMVRSKNGFSRPYNLSQLSNGNYIVRVSDGKRSKSEIITLQPQRKLLYKVTELGTSGKYAVHIPAQETTEVVISIYDEAHRKIYAETKALTDDFARVYTVKNASGKVTFQVLPR